MGVARLCAPSSDASTSDDVSGADGLQKTVAKLSGMLDDAAKHVAAVWCVHTLVPIRPRRRGERRSLRTFPGVSLRPGSLAFNPRPRRLSTPLLTPFNSTPISSLVWTITLSDGKAPADAEIGRHLSDALSAVPRLTKEQFEKLFGDSVADVLLTRYLANITKMQLMLAEKLQTTSLLV